MLPGDFDDGLAHAGYVEAVLAARPDRGPSRTFMGFVGVSGQVEEQMLRRGAVAARMGVRLFIVDLDGRVPSATAPRSAKFRAVWAHCRIMCIRSA